MRQERRIESFKKLHRSLTDPEERQKAKQLADRAFRRREKQDDTGL